MLILQKEEHDRVSIHNVITNALKYARASNSKQCFSPLNRLVIYIRMNNIYLSGSKELSLSLSPSCPFHPLTEYPLKSSTIRPHASAWYRLGQDFWSQARYLGQSTRCHVAVRTRWSWIGRERGKSEEGKDWGMPEFGKNCASTVPGFLESNVALELSEWLIKVKISSDVGLPRCIWWKLNPTLIKQHSYWNWAPI